MNFAIVIVAFLANSVHCAALSKEILFPPQLSGRIVDGVDAEPGSAPYQVFIKKTIKFPYFQICGGSIIGEKWIVTAGHCVHGIQPDDVEVLTGTNNLNIGGKYYYADKFFIHSRYYKPEFSNDIALIRLNSSIEFNDLTQPIEYSWEQLPDDAVLRMTGWGRLSGWDNHFPESLQTLDAKYVPYEECKRNHKNSSDVDIGHVCTLNESGGGACYGDSGGPLTYKGKLVAVVNWVTPDCGTGLPDAHASIAYYHDFIRTTINSN